MPDTSRNLLAEHLADNDDHCPVCRYSLRGLQSDTCPECGIALVLRVSENERTASRVWIAGLVAVCIASGPAFFNVIWIAIFAIQRGSLLSPGVPGGWLLLTGGTSVLSAAVLHYWLRGRKRISLAPLGHQRRLAALATVLACVYPASQFIRFFLW